MIGSVWNQPSWAPAAWVDGSWAGVVAPAAVPSAAGAPKRGRRGGLLHEERYFAELAAAAARGAASPVSQPRSNKSVSQPLPDFHSEDEEIILLYMASLYGA